MYRIGIDGGGTKSRLAVIESDAETFRVETGGINYNSFSEETIRNHITSAVLQLRDQGFTKTECTGIGIGAAGISNPKAAPFLKQVFLDLGFTCPVVIAGDHEAALLGGVGRNAGILLIGGTGSICIARNDSGKRFRCGGFGHIIDDAGSAYAVGRDMLNAIVRMEDGRGKPTALREAVYKHLQIEGLNGLIDYVYNATKTKRDIAALAVCLTEDLIQSDETAGEIARRAAEELVLHVDTVLSPKKMNYDLSSNRMLPLVLEGSLIRENREINRMFREMLGEKALPVRITPAKKDAAYGAALFVEMP